MAIKVSGTTVIDDDRNINNVGVFTATSYSGSGENLTDISATANEFQSIASGTLLDGSPVLINSDGTVSTVEGASPGFFDGSSSDVRDVRSTFDSTNNKIVITYRDFNNNNYGTCVVGEISGNTITFGTPIVFNSAYTIETALAYDSNTNRITISYIVSGGFDTIVGEVSGNSITFGTPTNYSGPAVQAWSATFDSLNNKIVIFYQDGVPDGVGNQGYGTAIVGTVTGGSTNSISFGTPTVFNTEHTETMKAIFDPDTNKVVVSYRSNSGIADYTGRAHVGTVSGTSVSFGSTQIFQNSYTIDTHMTYDTNENRIVIVYNTGTSINKSVIVGEVSGTSINFGTSVQINDQSKYVIFDPSTNKNIIFAQSQSVDGYKGRTLAYEATVTGATNSISVPADYSYILDYRSTIYEPVHESNSNKVCFPVIIYYNDSGPTIGAGAVQYQSNYSLTKDNFGGFSNGSYTNGQTATIQITGAVNDAQTGLTTTSKYYIRPDGSLRDFDGATTSYAGIAVDSNKIIVKG